MEIVFPAILKEEWATAKLADGTIVRNRPVLLLGMTDPAAKKKGLKTGSQTVVWAPTKGKPDPTPRTLPELERLAKDPIEPAQKEEGHCAYQFSNGDLVLFRHWINTIRPTGMFDRAGEPQLVVNFGTEITRIDHPEPDTPSAAKM